MNPIVALAGNPNTGKTAMFNSLTGARQHVGNYPGVTVEKKSGPCRADGMDLTVVDLPGTYSLTAYSLEEVVARDFLVREKPPAIINIVDASNLERNLYLTLQFMELGIPLVIALNMVDVAKQRGILIDAQKLSRLLGLPVTETIARNGRGRAELLASCAGLLRAGNEPKPLEISYGQDIDEALRKLCSIILAAGFLTDTYPARWVALKYLEQDEQVISLGEQQSPEVSGRLKAIVQDASRHIAATLDSYPEAVIADHRYGFIKSILRQGVIEYGKDRDRLLLTDRLDQVLTNRFAGPLIMMGVIFGLYRLTFSYSEWPVGLLEGFFGWLGGLAEAGLPEGLLKSLVISGVIDGVGGVLGFVPLIMLMFLGISFLEDSGYLARMAFMLDRVFRAFGLHGSSVMPFIISGGIAGGCAVPGVMAARTIKSPRERLATLLTAPFMNCGAKLPVFALLVGAFFAENQAGMMLLITAIAWLGALLSARLLRSTVIRGPATPFVMELPPYRLPTFKGLFIHTWERTRQYIKKAGTVILGISVLIWAMMTFPGLPDSRAKQYQAERAALLASAPAAVSEQAQADVEEGDLSPEARELRGAILQVDAREAQDALKHSAAGRMGSALESVSRFAGFDWRTNIALVGGFAAKEVVVSTLGTAYSLGEVDPEETGSLSQVLARSPGWSARTAFALILFTIFYAPCFVAVVCIARESSWKWAAFSVVFNTALAFLLAVLAYQLGGLLGA